MNNLILEEEEGLLRQKLMSRESLVTRKSKEWIFTNEPEDHLDAGRRVKQNHKG